MRARIEGAWQAEECKAAPHALFAPPMVVSPQSVLAVAYNGVLATGGAAAWAMAAIGAPIRASPKLMTLKARRDIAHPAAGSRQPSSALSGHIG